MPNGGKDETTTVVSKSSGSSGDKTTSTTTISESSSSSSSQSGVEHGHLAGNTEAHLTVSSDGHDDCGCGGAGHYTYEIADKDLKYLDSSDVTTTSTQVHLHSSDCETQVKKLNNDNDHLTKQLKSANSVISTLTGEKSWVLDELEECRHEYSCITEDFVTITTEVKILKKKIQVSVDDSTKLKTQLIAANADAQKWKTKSDSYEIDLKTTKEINIKLTNTVNEYTTTITNLHITITELTIKNNKCDAESNEWKRKWEAENAKVIKNEKTIKDLEASNADLKGKIDKLNEDLSCCQNEKHQKDIEINNLKNSVSDLKNKLSCCTVDLGSCNVALKRVTAEYDADELRDHEEAIVRARLQLELGECMARKKDIETNYESEKKCVINCKNEIVVIREDCTKRYQKYEDDITDLKITFKGSLDKCEALVKSEKDNNAKCRIEITNLQIRIVEIENKLTISIKVSEDWQKKNQCCEDDSITLRRTIETLRTNLADTNKQLSICVANSNSLQSELTSCKSNWDICRNELSETKKKLADKEVIIVNLNIQINSLESSIKCCQADLSGLRCDVNHYLAGVKSAEEKAYEYVSQVLGILDGNKKSMSNFVGSHDITCRA